MRAGIYIRCSNEAQDRQTLKVQEEKCRKYCDYREWEVHGVFPDDGWSGAEKNRPAFQEVLRLAESGEIQAMVVYRYDRFSRSLLHSVETLERLKEWNVNLVSTEESFDLTSDVGQLVFKFLIMFAEFERTSIAQRSADAKRRVLRQGRMTQGKPPFGYSNGPDGITVNKDEADFVKKIFIWYMEGRKLEEIAELASLGKSSIERILKNDLYWSGKYSVRFGDETKRIGVPPIIHRRAFEKVRGIRQSKRTMTRTSSYSFLLKGKIYCGKCGSNLYGRDMDPYHYYQHKCDGKVVSLKAEELEGKIKNKIEEVFGNPKAIMGEIEKKRRESERNIAKWREKIDKIGSEIAKLESDREEIIDSVPATKGEMRQALLKRGEEMSNKITRLERLKAEYEDKLEESKWPQMLVSDREVIDGILRKKDIDRMFPPRSIEYDPDTGEIVCHYPVEFSVKSRDR